MPFDFATAKAIARRVVHATFGVQAFYSADAISAPVEMRARWHNRISKPFGDLDNGGYSEIIEGVDRVVLIPEDIDGYDVTLVRGGKITFPKILPGVEFFLEHMEPATGPLEQAWALTRK